MSREKETPLSKFVTTLGRLLPKFERRELPLSRLDNARMALDGAAVPLPNNAGPQLPTELRGGIHEVALASDGTKAVVGKYRGGDREPIVLLVVKPKSTEFVKLDSAPIIEDPFFPEGSNRPAYMRVQPNPSSGKHGMVVEWVWDCVEYEVTLPGNRSGHEHRPLFWMRGGLPQGAVIVDSKLYTLERGHAKQVAPARADNLGLLKPFHTQAISDHLLSLWSGQTDQGYRIRWRGIERGNLFISADSVTEGPDGQPYFLAKLHATDSTRLFNMDGEKTILGHKPKGIWTAPGQIFTLEKVAQADAEHGPTSRVHEVISGWSSEVLEDTQVEQVWPVDLAGRAAAIYNHDSRTMCIINSAGQIGSDVPNCGEIGPMSPRTGVTKRGKTFVFQDDDNFGFLLEGRTQFAAHRIPRQGLRLEHLVLMDDGSIQAVTKVGTAVITYKFYDPNV